MEGNLLASARDFNVGADPVEILSFFNEEFGRQVQLGIELRSGPAPGLMKYIFSGSPFTFVDEFNTASGTLYGHANDAFCN
jgi:hypothetical protein